MDGSGSGLRTDIATADVYEIPYRSLVPLEIEALLVAGRCLSATPEAAGAARVMPPCFAMGQAVGTAAALAAERGISPRRVEVAELQAELRKHGAILS